MFPGGKMKALTLSYDDGVEQDRKLLEVVNRYGLKATFNLNSGIQSGASRWSRGEVEVRRMNIAGLPALYKGHEIACHSLTHPHLEALDADTIYNELASDKSNLERLFQTEVTGMAWPYGTYNETCAAAARQCGLRYARGVESSRAFTVPARETLMAFSPTCHHDDTELFSLAEAFFASHPDTPSLFYLWGHSYEFDINNNWNMLEEFCRMASRRDDVFYGTNREVLL